LKITERDLEFNFTGALGAFKFDDGATHASSSIQAVDFIVEYTDCYRFVEVKDPDDPSAVNIDAFREKLRTGKLIRSLAGKYRDTLFFRVFEGKFEGKENKKIEYIVLLSMSALDDALLLTKTEELQKSIPLTHANWQQNSVSVCLLLNMDQWKRRYGASSIRRLSEATDEDSDALPA
jgi:hypothetical protein